MINVTKLLPARIYTCDFEMIGKLQNSYILRNMQAGAKLLGITGWCESTNNGNVRGQLQGSPHRVMVMRNWLKDMPITRARIDYLRYSEMVENRYPTFHDFKIRPETEILERYVMRDEPKDYNNLL